MEAFESTSICVIYGTFNHLHAIQTVDMADLKCFVKLNIFKERRSIGVYFEMLILVCITGVKLNRNEILSVGEQ